MRWTRGDRSNIEDRRGQGGGGGLGGLGGLGGGRTVGAGGLVVAVVLSLLFGKDFVSGLVGGGGGTPSGPVQSTAQEEQLVDFVDAAMRDQERTWTELLGGRYRDTRVVLYRGGTGTACGAGDARMGPFYCPGDGLVYLDLSFVDELARMGGAGDFALAYVIGHEVGHHVQNVLRLRAGSVPQELQADCFAGVWAHHAASRNMLEPGDLEEGLATASAIGDDTLSRRAGREVVEESFTHGSSAQRVAAFRRGFDAGEPDACDAGRF
jgi:predicted metalloprotease